MAAAATGTAGAKYNNQVNEAAEEMAVAAATVATRTTATATATAAAAAVMATAASWKND
jgi:hypothetical protein